MLQRTAACATGVTRPAAGPEPAGGLLSGRLWALRSPRGTRPPGRLISAGSASAGAAGRRRMPLALAFATCRPAGRSTWDAGGATWPARSWTADGGHRGRALGRRLRGLPRGRGVDARAGDARRRYQVDPGTYDLAVFQHSLEHARDPVSDLRHAAAALRAPVGSSSITVPNFGSGRHAVRPRAGSIWTCRATACTSRRTGCGRRWPPRGSSRSGSRRARSSIGLPASLQYAAVGRCLFPEGLRLRVAAGPVRAHVAALTAGGPDRRLRRSAPRGGAAAGLAAARAVAARSPPPSPRPGPDRRSARCRRAGAPAVSVALRRAERSAERHGLHVIGRHGHARPASPPPSWAASFPRASARIGRPR